MKSELSFFLGRTDQDVRVRRGDSLGRSQIYLEAARRVDRNRDPLCEYAWSCCAVSMVAIGEDKRSPEAEDYADTFAPECVEQWPGDAEHRLQGAYAEVGRDAKALRVLALCFMAAIAEDEERSSRRQGKAPTRTKAR
jgi:hypothetical protein